MDVMRMVTINTSRVVRFMAVGFIYIKLRRLSLINQKFAGKIFKNYMNGREGVIEEIDREGN
jgi:hypothetical protein